MSTSSKREILEKAANRLKNTELPIRQRLAETYNLELSQLSDLDFIEDDRKKAFDKISTTLEAEEAGKMPTRAHRSAEMLSLDQASELAMEIIELKEAQLR